MQHITGMYHTIMDMAYSKLVFSFIFSPVFVCVVLGINCDLTEGHGLLWQVCIFAYGQTGSGKTYTMMGRPDAPDLKGLIPRSLEQIFQTSQSLKDQGWKYKMQVSILHPDFHVVTSKWKLKYLIKYL